MALITVTSLLPPGGGNVVIVDHAGVSWNIPPGGSVFIPNNVLYSENFTPALNAGQITVGSNWVDPSGGGGGGGGGSNSPDLTTGNAAGMVYLSSTIRENATAGGRNVFLEYYNGTAWVPLNAPANAPAWVALQAYNAGDIVLAGDGNLYYAKMAIAINSSDTGPGSPKWSLLDSTSGPANALLPTYTAGNNYLINQLVIDSTGNTWRANSAITNAAVKMPTGVLGVGQTWTQVNCPANAQAAAVTYDPASNSYSAGYTVQYQDGIVYQLIKPSVLPGNPLPGTDPLTWKAISPTYAYSIPLYNSSNVYNDGAEVIGPDGLIYRANGSILPANGWRTGVLGTTGYWTNIGDFNSSTVQVGAAAWDTTKQYVVGQTMLSNGVIYKANGTINANNLVITIGNVGSTWTAIKQLSSPTISVWNQNVQYQTGQLVFYTDVINNISLPYYANSNIPAGTPFAIGIAGTPGTFTLVNNQNISATTYVTGVSYTAGQLVQYSDNNVYYANSNIASTTPFLIGVAGTTNTFTLLPPFATANSTGNPWTAAGPGNLGYVAGQLVTNGGQVYVANGTIATGITPFPIGTSGATFKLATAIPPVSTANLIQYDSTKAYLAGSLVVDSKGDLWMANSAMPANATVFVTGTLGTVNTWTQLNCAGGTQVSATDFVSNTNYLNNQTVKVGGVVYAAVGTVSQATFTLGASWNQVSPVSSNQVMAIPIYNAVPGAYVAGAQVYWTDGNVYQANTAITAGTVFATGVAGTANTWVQVNVVTGKQTGAVSYVQKAAYNAGQTVLYQGVVYSCNAAILANADTTFTAGHWTQVSPVVAATVTPAAIPNFQSSTSYVAGSQVYFTDGHIYYANGAVNQVTFATAVDGTSGFWTQLDCPSGYQNSAAKWVGSISPSYVLGQTALYTDGVVYKCITPNNDANFTPANWASVTYPVPYVAPVVKTFNSTSNYVAGSLVVDINGDTWVANSLMTPSANFPTGMLGTSGTWTQLNVTSGSQASAGTNTWAATTSYNTGNTVKYTVAAGGDDAIYKANAAITGSASNAFTIGTTGATWTKVSPVAANPISVWSPTASYVKYQLVIYTDNQVYMANANMGATATFATGTMGTASTWSLTQASPYWNKLNSYIANAAVIYTDGQVYTANSAIAANTAWVVGTAANQWSPYVQSYISIPKYDNTKNYYAGQLVTGPTGFTYKANANIPSGTTWATGTTGATWTSIDMNSAVYSPATNAAIDNTTYFYNGTYFMNKGSTLTLTSTPQAGNWIRVNNVDGLGSVSNPVTIGTTATTVQGQGSDYVIDNAYGSVTLRYTGTTWFIEANK